MRYPRLNGRYFTRFQLFAHRRMTCYVGRSIGAGLDWIAGLYNFVDITLLKALSLA
jgi:hypothetical protein